MKLYYIANARIPTEKAHGINIIKMCEAFAHSGADVTLILPKRRNIIKTDPFIFYGVSKNFKIEYIPMFDLIGNPIFYWLSQLSFSVSLMFSPIIRKSHNTVIFSREMLLSWFLSMRGFSTFFDMHGFPEQSIWLWRIAMKKMKGIVLTNRQKLERAKTILRIPEKKLLIYPNGYDPNLFKIIINKETLRKELRLPTGKIVMYTGHLYQWKGAHILAETSHLLPNISFVFVGGTEDKIREFKKKYPYKNLFFLGHKMYTSIPKYLKVADILVLPSSAKSFGRRTTHSLYDASPIKMFEYMASGTPIIASNLPSIREILNERNAVLVKPDSVKDLSHIIANLFNDEKKMVNISMNAIKGVSIYTWNNRAEKILEFIKTKLNNKTYE